MTRVFKYPILKISLLIFFSGLITGKLISSEIYFTPPDSGITDTSKNIIIIYDTVKTHKIIYVYDTVLVYDTLYLPDTTIQAKKTSSFSLDLSVTSFYPVKSLKTKDPEFDDLILYKNNTEKMQAGYSVGTELNFSYKKWKISSGLMFSQMSEIVNLNIYKMTFFPDDTIIINDNSYWHTTVIDTFYQVFDSVLTPVIVIDSNWVADIDTNQISGYDTLLNKQEYSGINKYMYIEFPLIFGNEIYRSDRSFIYARLGMISSFLVKVSGKTIIPPDESSIISLADCPFVTVNLSIYAGLQYNYKLSDKINVFGEIFYRNMLKSVYDKSVNLSEKKNLPGIKFGISYLF